MDVPLLVPGRLLRELETSDGLHEMASAVVHEAHLSRTAGVGAVETAAANGTLIQQDE